MIKNHLKIKILYFSFGPQEHKSYWLGLALTEFQDICIKSRHPTSTKKENYSVLCFHF